jgi:hypothetical protein
MNRILLFNFGDLPHCSHPRRPVGRASGWTDENHPFVFVGMFTLDGLYGQANLGGGGTLQRKRLIGIGSALGLAATTLGILAARLAILRGLLEPRISKLLARRLEASHRVGEKSGSTARWRHSYRADPSPNLRMRSGSAQPPRLELQTSQTTTLQCFRDSESRRRSLNAWVL